jgi:hypothetical protein
MKAVPGPGGPSCRGRTKSYARTPLPLGGLFFLFLINLFIRAALASASRLKPAAFRNRPAREIRPRPYVFVGGRNLTSARPSRWGVVGPRDDGRNRLQPRFRPAKRESGTTVRPLPRKTRWGASGRLVGPPRGSLGLLPGGPKKSVSHAIRKTAFAWQSKFWAVPRHLASKSKR